MREALQGSGGNGQCQGPVAGAAEGHRGGRREGSGRGGVQSSWGLVHHHEDITLTLKRIRSIKDSLGIEQIG